MIQFRLGKKPLRLLVFMILVTMVLSGCGNSKYEPFAQITTAQGQEDSTETVSFTIEETSVSNEALSPVGGPEAANAEETITYQEVHDWVVVTADALNVRAEDNTDARIFVQLHPGDVLERIGYHEEWSQVIYDGDVAYVATAMVEVTEEPIPESAGETTGSGETVSSEDGSNASEKSSGELGISAVAASVTEADGSAVEAAEAGIPVYEKTGTVPKEEITVPLNGHVVAIDAGHQAKANAEKEQIGPGSTTKKAKMPEGAVGAATGVKEYEPTLTVAKKLESELKARGYEIVMIRTSHDVNLSNAERSVIANESEAEIFIRLHANSMENSGIYGALAMCMTEHNPYNSELHQDSYRLSKKIINNICDLTGTKNRGVQKVDNSSAINWCEIPVSVVEMGFLTNPDEDRWLQNEEYQSKIVTGIANAVDFYFSEEQ